MEFVCLISPKLLDNYWRVHETVYYIYPIGTKYGVGINIKDDKRLVDNQHYPGQYIHCILYNTLLNHRDLIGYLRSRDIK